MNRGLNIFQILFPFDNSLSFLDHIITLMFANKIATFIFFLALFLGAILFFWITREITTWFLQTKKIKEQNQLLAEQNRILISKVDAINVNLHNINKPASPFLTAEKTAIGQIGQSIDPVTDVITDNFDVTQKQDDDSVLPPSKQPSLDS